MKCADKKTEEYKERYLTALKTIEQIIPIISEIFTRTGCVKPTSEVDELKGENGVCESNIMQYLGMIERRTAEIMQGYANEKSSNDPTALNLNDVKRDFFPKSQMCIEPPAAEDFSSGEESDLEDDERPLTREELELKTERGMKMKTERSKHVLMKKK